LATGVFLFMSTQFQLEHL